MVGGDILLTLGIEQFNRRKNYFVFGLHGNPLNMSNYSIGHSTSIGHLPDRLPTSRYNLLFNPNLHVTIATAAHLITMWRHNISDQEPQRDQTQKLTKASPFMSGMINSSIRVLSLSAPCEATAYDYRHWWRWLYRQ